MYSKKKVQKYNIPLIYKKIKSTKHLIKGYYRILFNRILCLNNNGKMKISTELKLSIHVINNPGKSSPGKNNPEKK